MNQTPWNRRAFVYLVDGKVGSCIDDVKDDSSDGRYEEELSTSPTSSAKAKSPAEAGRSFEADAPSHSLVTVLTVAALLRALVPALLAAGIIRLIRVVTAVRIAILLLLLILLLLILIGLLLVLIGHVLALLTLPLERGGS